MFKRIKNYCIKSLEIIAAGRVVVGGGDWSCYVDR